MNLKDMIEKIFKCGDAHTDEKGNVYLFFENISHMTVAGIYEFLKELGFGKIKWTKKMALDRTDDYMYVLKCVPPKEITVHIESGDGTFCLECPEFAEPTFETDTERVTEGMEKWIFPNLKSKPTY